MDKCVKERGSGFQGSSPSGSPLLLGRWEGCSFPCPWSLIRAIWLLFWALGWRQKWCVSPKDFIVSVRLWCILFSYYSSWGGSMFQVVQLEDGKFCISLERWGAAWVWMPWKVEDLEMRTLFWVILMGLTACVFKGIGDAMREEGSEGQPHWWLWIWRKGTVRQRNVGSPEARSVEMDSSRKPAVWSPGLLTPWL